MKATQPFSTNLGKHEPGCDNRRGICPTTRPGWKQPSRAGPCRSRSLAATYSPTASRPRPSRNDGGHRHDSGGRDRFSSVVWLPWEMEGVVSSLRGRVAVVTGASRGVGKGIALALGEAGATVYVTGRSDAGGTTEGLPGTVVETTDAVTQRGGQGVAVRFAPTAGAEGETPFARREA